MFAAEADVAAESVVVEPPDSFAVVVVFVVTVVEGLAEVLALDPCVVGPELLEAEAEEAQETVDGRAEPLEAAPAGDEVATGTFPELAFNAASLSASIFCSSEMEMAFGTGVTFQGLLAPDERREGSVASLLVAVGAEESMISVGTL